LLAAAVGGSAIVVMGALTAMAAGQPVSDPPMADSGHESKGPVATVDMGGGMNRGATMTEVAATTTTPGATLPMEKAAPTVKAKAFQ
jgi:hypothetical protein